MFFFLIFKVIIFRQTLAANDQHKMAALMFWVFFFKQCEEEEMDFFSVLKRQIFILR